MSIIIDAEQGGIAPLHPAGFAARDTPQIDRND